MCGARNGFLVPRSIHRGDRIKTTGWQLDLSPLGACRQEAHAVTVITHFPRLSSWASAAPCELGLSCVHHHVLGAQGTAVGGSGCKGVTEPLRGTGGCSQGAGSTEPIAGSHRQCRQPQLPLLGFSQKERVLTLSPHSLTDPKPSPTLHSLLLEIALHPDLASEV